MSKANIFEVKAKLSEYLDRAAQGERIVICRHNKPVAELRAVTEARTEPRPIGPLPGRPTFDVPPSFFEPLPADELDRWEGITSTDPLSPGWAVSSGRGPSGAGASRVADEKHQYGAAPKKRGAGHAPGRTPGRPVRGSTGRSKP